jgi:hypothetical protein
MVIKQKMNKHDKNERMPVSVTALKIPENIFTIVAEKVTKF